MSIAFVDLQRQYETIAADVTAAMADVIHRSAFIGGDDVARFEREFAAYCEAAHCVGVASGTDALELSLRALEIGPGDEVITVPNTFIATAAAISAVGATPVFVDVDEATYQLDVSRLPAAITPRTRAIMPVHLYGHPADLDPILALAAAHGLAVVEDACQAHGARYQGRRVGAIGHVGCFSFYPGKNLGAYGDAGAVVTNSAELAGRIRQMADHGREDKYRHAIVGRNSRLDGLQAAVLSVKLRHLDDWNAARRRIADALTERLLPEAAIPPATAPGCEPVYHLYVVRVEDRERVRAALAEAGIASGIHYPLPLHLQPAYRDACLAAGIGEGSFPVAEAHAAQILSLPIFPELRDEELARVCAIVNQAATPALV
ncbi:MAG TPA: DegT/DnrJ/EryC1/StrS family aminotransferase [Thermomicrobiales bacterium]|nr:DegT/DnrJ/EryC1/StrS family aminotransferase [Thermomicrobiales bacterium]